MEESVKWKCRYRIQKYNSDIEEYFKAFGSSEGLRRFLEENPPSEDIERDGNLLMTLGAASIWTALTSSTAATGPFAASTAAIGVGDSTTAASASQSNLQASFNAYRAPMNSGFPAVVNNTVQFQASFGASVANFAWNEWGVFSEVGSGSPPAGGVMLNRAVPSGGLGVKSTNSTWILSVTLSLS